MSRPTGAGAGGRVRPFCSRMAAEEGVWGGATDPVGGGARLGRGWGEEPQTPVGAGPGRGRAGAGVGGGTQNPGPGPGQSPCPAAGNVQTSEADASFCANAAQG